MWQWAMCGVACVAMIGCSKKDDVPNKPSAKEPFKIPLSIIADNYPVAYFTERVAGRDLAQVTLPVKPGRDPAYWRPSAEDVAALQKADLVVINGAGYAKWYDTVSLDESKVVDTSRGFKDKFITIKDAVVHSHGPEGEHSHEGLASNVWLDPDLAVLQAQAIASALKERLPSKSDQIDNNLAALEKDLKDFGVRLKDLSSKKSEPLLASHPVYDYLARFGGWKLESVHWEPDEVPDEKGWQELDELLKKHPAKWMIWEGQPVDETVQKLNARGINSVVFNVCPSKPATGDFLSVMNENLENLKRVFVYEADGG